MAVNKGAVGYFTQKFKYTTSPTDVRRALDMRDKSVVFIDVRDKGSFKAGHIPGALSIPGTDMPEMLHKLPKDKTLILYCYNITCFAAPHAALYLAKKGYKVMELIGGFEEYRKNGHPVEKG